jgi:hypothetical protein
MTLTIPVENNQQPEEWRPVVGWEGIYEISNLGRVSRQKAGRGVRPSTRPDGRRLLKATPGNHGYPQVSLHHDDNRTSAPVHWLVAEAFIGPRTETVDHINGDRTDNRAINLRYLSRSANAEAAWERLGHDQGRLSAARLTPEMVLEIRRRVADGETQASVARIFNISSSHCNHIVHGKLWADLPERIHGTDPILPPVRKVAACGTYAGYFRHRRNAETPCDLCLAAYRTRQNSYYTRRRALTPVRPTEDRPEAA